MTGGGTDGGHGELHEHQSDWVWLTTLGSRQVSTAQLVRLGHQRWDIENRGFNELVNGWHADHIYKHAPHAIETFLLTTFLAFNLYHAFVARNLKPSLRRAIQHPRRTASAGSSRPLPDCYFAAIKIFG